MASQADYAFNRRKDPRRRGICSINCLKYILFLFNFIFLVAGGAILGVGIWTLHTRHQQILLLASPTYLAVTALFISAGVLVLIITFFGCVALAREDRCYVFMYMTGILLVLIMEAVAGILAYTYDLEMDMQENLTKTFNENYGKDFDLSSTIDAVQMEFKCCGALIFSQWEQSYWKITGSSLNNSVPDSCCKTPSEMCGVSNHPSNIWYTGCIHDLGDEMVDHLLLLGAIGVGISSINVVGLLFSCIFFVKLKDLDDY